MATQESKTENSGLVQITEDEAALYDRQIRLWGLDAQQRMRNAKILIIGLRGTAAETIKNIVLAGIGTLIIADSEHVSEEDLGAGFFFRDEDVGKKRVMAAKARVEALNPLVVVETIYCMDQLQLDMTIQSADLICVTDWDREQVKRINEVCRRFRKPFYAGGCFGLMGYIFCDLLEHEYLAPNRSVGKAAEAKSVRVIASYVPLGEALRHRWTGLTKRQTKELNPSVVFTILALWDFRYRSGGLPWGIDDTKMLQGIADRLVSEAGVHKDVITAVPGGLIATASTTARNEFAPVCAVVGGLLGQDILKTLGKQEAPIANFLTFDGNTGGASVCRMNML